MTEAAAPALGILMLETRFPRIPGDVGNPTSWPFPVRIRTVPQATPERVVTRRAEGLLEGFIDAGHALAENGCVGLTTTCGFLSLFQRDLAAALPVPVLASTLSQVALVDRLLPEGCRAGVLTISAKALGPDHLSAADVPAGTPIGSPETGREFTRAILGDHETLDVAAARADLVDAALAMRAAHPALGAIVMECTNMGPYAADVAEATGLPCYSPITLLSWFYAGLVPPRFAAG